MEHGLQKIIYIEDEPDIIVIAEIALKDIGQFDVKCFTSGLEGIQEALKFKPDLFLIDVMMPVIDGPSTVREIRKHEELQNIPIIFMTAKTQQSEIKQYMELGALTVITKPFNPMTLAEEVKAAWEKHHAR